MAQKIVILLTEGDHDAAFLFRILKANGFIKYSKIIRDFPKPLDNLLAHDILNISIPDESIQNARTRFLPSNVVTLGDNMLLIYSIHGDSRGDKRIKLIDTIKSFKPKSKTTIAGQTPEIDAFEKTSFSVLYFLDADDKGIKVRLSEINKELETIFTAVQLTPFTTNANLQTIDDIQIGAYIFAEAGKDIGKLEDILLPMMEAGNEDIFKEARNFLSIHESTALFKGNVEYHADKSIKKIFGEKYHLKKSLIGTVGQLQKSGKSNTVCISDANYINDSKLKADLTCNSILEFIKKGMI